MKFARAGMMFAMAAVMLFIVIAIIPAAAELNITHTIDGKTIFSNGSYWIEWDPVSNHVTGDQFYINGTTNLSIGTVLTCEFFDPTIYCRTKNCKQLGSGISKEIIVESGNQPGTNTVSFFINTTGFKNERYVFDFRTSSSNNPSEIDAFYMSHTVNNNIALLSTENVQTIKPTSKYLGSTPTSPVLGIFLGILVIGSAALLRTRPKK